MSSTFYWQPVAPQENKSLSTSFKFLLRDSKDLSQHEQLILSSSDVPWLRGVLAATSDDYIKGDVQVLLEALETYEEVRLWEVF